MRARVLVLELGTRPDVVGVASIFSLRTPPSASRASAPLIGPDLSTAEDKRAALRLAADDPLNTGRLLTPDLHDMLVIVRLGDERISEASRTAAEIETTAQTAFANTPVTFGISGLSLLRADIIAGIVHDQLVMNSLGAVIGFALCLIVFRGLALALLAGLPAVVALIWVLGFIGYSGVGINTLTNALPVLILVLGFADGMHLTFDYRREMAAGEDSVVAIKKALLQSGPACIMTALTTALAFAALLLSRSQLINQLGVAGVAAILITVIATLWINPLLARWAATVPRFRRQFAAATPPLAFPSRAWSRALRAILARPVAISVVSIALICLSVALYLRVDIRHSFLENVDRNAPYFREFQTIEGLFGPLSSFNVIVPVVANFGGSVISSAALARLGRVHEALAAELGAQRVRSLWNLAEWLDPDQPEATGAEIADLLEEAGTSGASTFVARDVSAMNIVIATSDIWSNEIRAQAAVAEAAATAATGDDGLPPPRAGGLLVMSATVSTIMISDLNISFLADVLVSGIAIAIWCRSMVTGLLALLPNILPIAVLGAWLTVSGNGLQFTSGLALTIAFGIAVDDTLHSLNRLRPRLRSTGRIGIEDIRTAYDEIAPVIVATTLILCFGIGAALLSRIPTVVYFGQLSISVFLLALVADLVMLPALLVLFARSRRGR